MKIIDNKEKKLLCISLLLCVNVCEGMVVPGAVAAPTGQAPQQPVTQAAPQPVQQQVGTTVQLIVVDGKQYIKDPTTGELRSVGVSQQQPQQTTQQGQYIQGQYGQNPYQPPYAPQYPYSQYPQGANPYGVQQGRLGYVAQRAAQQYVGNLYNQQQSPYGGNQHQQQQSPYGQLGGQGHGYSPYQQGQASMMGKGGAGQSMIQPTEKPENQQQQDQSQVAPHHSGGLQNLVHSAGQMVHKVVNGVVQGVENGGITPTGVVNTVNGVVNAVEKSPQGSALIRTAAGFFNRK